MISKIVQFIKSSFGENIAKVNKDAFLKTVGTGWYVGLFLVCILFIFIYLKKKMSKDKANKEHYLRLILIFGVYSVIVLLLNLNPFFVNLYVKLFGDGVYWRVYWMLPIGIVLAYTATELIFISSKKYKQIVSGLIIVAVLLLGGKFIYNSDNFKNVHNYYKIPDNVLGILMEISADDEEYKKLAGPEEFTIYTRQFDGTILVEDGRQVSMNYPESSLVWKITNGKTEEIAIQAKEDKCNYIIINNSTEMEGNLTDYGFYVFHKNVDYTVYKANYKNSSWKVTQYGNNDSGRQHMCYTIEGDSEGLIIVDGGYRDNKETLEILKQKISEHNEVVDAWIITHFDDDHVGAYITLSEEIKNLKVKKLFVPNAPSLEICKPRFKLYTDEDWYVYSKALEIDIPEKQVVHAGDKFENIMGLKLEVLSSYEDWMQDKIDNIINNGSIVFKLSGNNESMMFCGDAQSPEIEEFLMQNYGDKLKSDYLQVGHHGNNWFSENFYKTVSPKVAFFAAPRSIMLNEVKVSWYTTTQLTELLQNMGVKIYYFKDSPASVIIK